LLILDEPCAGLDPAAREQFLAFLERFATDPGNPGTILVTHHVEEITPAFSRALLLRDGCVLAKGGIKSVLTGANLSETFAIPVTLSRNRKTGRFALQFQ
jgi:iron complex transport system ATP-binding protein